MNAPVRTHPSGDQLRLFGIGQMDATEAAAIEEHVDSCPVCCQTLKGLASDTLIELLRAAVITSVVATPAGCVTTPAQSAAALSDTGEGSPVASGTDALLRASPGVAEIPEGLRDHPRYRLLELLGRGGMGAVHKAEHRLMERPVAIKIIDRGLTARPEMVERFRREVKAAARLSHPNIVQAFDAEQAGDTHFLVMEFVPGTHLGCLVAERGPLPVAEACDYIRQAALGLQYAHEHGMVHRDVKPHNLMRTPEGRIKILDFGLARFVREQRPERTDVSHVTGPGMFLGTADYIAPEQASDCHKADIRADIYSLGCTLYHLLTGRAPFPTGTLMDKAIKHATEQPVALSELRLNLPAGLEAVIAKMMAKQPGQRYQTPGEVAFALAPFAVAGGPHAIPLAIAMAEPVRPGKPDMRIEPSPPVAVHAAPSRTALLSAEAVGARQLAGSGQKGRRRRLLVAALAALLVVGAVVAGVAVYRIQTDEGELVITTESDDVKVVITQGGKEIAIIDTSTEKSITLNSGEYGLELKDAPKGLKLNIDKATLTRGEKVVAKIEMRPIPEKVGEVRKFVGHASGIYPVAFSPDGRLILTGASTPASDPGPCDVQLWDATTGRLVDSLKGHNTGICCAMFSADGKRIVAGSIHHNNSCTVWDVRSGKEPQRFTHAPGLDILGVAIAPDGARIFSSEVWTVRSWDVRTGKEGKPFLGHDNVLCLALSRDGRKLVAGGGNRDPHIHVWDVESGKDVVRFAGHVDGEGGGRGIAFSPDGGRILSGGYDGTVRLWDIRTEKEVCCFKDNSGIVYGVSFSADGRRILSGGTDRKVRLWDVETGRVLQRFEGHTAAVMSVAFSPDGRFAVSGSADNTARLWRLPDPKPTKDKP